MNLTEAVKAAGVVGAGGAGFPTHVKLSAKAECFLAVSYTHLTLPTKLEV